jgi:glycine hydroxymethyltransferase
MGDVEMQAIADMIAGVLVEGREPAHVRAEALELRAGFQRVHYVFGDTSAASVSRVL